MSGGGPGPRTVARLTLEPYWSRRLESEASFCWSSRPGLERLLWKAPPGSPGATVDPWIE